MKWQFIRGKLRMSGSATANWAHWGVQLLSVFLWFVLWWLLLGFDRLRLGFRWCIPVFLFAMMEAVGIAVEYPKTYIYKYENEINFIKQIEDNAEKMVAAITILAAVPAFFLRGDIPLPAEFFSLVFTAAVGILGGTLSWFGATNEGSSPIMIILIRKVKAESYRHSLTWTLAATLSLYDWIAVNTKL